MSSLISDLTNEFRYIGNDLNYFLYEGRVKNGVRKEHTIEEYEKKLEQIRLECWDYYQRSSNELGWQ